MYRSPKEKLIKDSFFNEPGVQSELQTFWLSENDYKNLKDLKFHKDKIFLEGNLIYKVKKDKKSYKTHFYTLYNDRIVCYKTKVAEDLCIFITYNNMYEILFAENKEDFFKWRDNLYNKVILTYFQKNYLVLKIIGKGSFAKVLYTQRVSDKKEFATKTFDKKKMLLEKNPERTKLSIINEIMIMRHLDHPNILKLHEVYEGDHHLYLVMDILKGGELFERIVNIVMVQLLRALDYLHDRNIMHRDIKPENLILRDDNTMELVLADFGLAEFVDSPRIFTRCGTPGYVAPEVLLDKPYGLKVDVFSCGIILYNLLTGCSIFSGDSYNEVVYKNKNCKINWQFEKINLKLSSEGKYCNNLKGVNLLHLMLAKEPEDRPTIKEILNHPWITKFSDPNYDPSLDDYENENDYLNLNINLNPTDKDKNISEQYVRTPIMNGRLKTMNTKAESMTSPILGQDGDIKYKKILNIKEKVIYGNENKLNDNLKKFIPEEKEDDKDDELDENIKSSDDINEGPSLSEKFPKQGIVKYQPSKDIFVDEKLEEKPGNGQVIIRKNMKNIISD